MADLTKTVEIIFGGKNEITGVIGDIGKSFNSLDDITSKVTDPLAKIGDSVVKIDAALAALAVGGMALAIKQSSDFNQGFALISTSVDATGEDLKKYRESILAYSADSTKSIEEINASLYTAAQAGIKWGDSLNFIGKAEELAVANHANLNTTVDLLTGTMNAYGFTIKDLAHLNDVYFTSTLIGKQTIDELGTSMGMVVGIAAGAGVSFESLSAAIATLTAKGMDTEQAITAVKNVITTIVSPSKEASDAAKALGLNFSLTELNAKGFSAMLAEIMQKTGGSKEKLVELFSEVRAMNGVLQLTGDGMKFFNNALVEIEQSSGSATRAYDKMAETFEAQSQKLINAGRGVLIAFGTELEPIAAKVAGSLGALFAGIKIGIDAGAFDPLFDYLEKVGTSVAEWLAAVAKAFPEALAKLDYRGLIDALEALREAFGGYLGDLDLTKADDLATALQTLIDIITGLVRVSSGMVDAFRPFVQTAAEFLMTLADAGPKTQDTIGKVLAFAQVIEKAGLAVFAAIMFIDEYKLSIKGIFEVLAGGTQIMWNGLEVMLTAVKGLFLILEGLLVSFIDKLTFGMFPGLQDLTAEITKQGEEINVAFAKNGAEAAQGLSLLSSGLVRLATESGTTRNRAEELRKKFAEMPTEIKTTVKLDQADESLKKIDTVSKSLQALPDAREVGVKVLADGTSIEKAYGAVIARFPDGKVLLTNVGVYADEMKLTATQQKIEEAVPKVKQMEIQAKIDETKIKAESDKIQKLVEWKAKVDIAQIESATKILETTFKSIDSTIQSTGQTLSSMIGDYTNAIGKGGTSFIERQIEEEARRRDEALKMQKDLTEAEVELLKARANALAENKEAIIKIQADGLQPQLEAFMWEILSAIQVRATQEGATFLIGA